MARKRESPKSTVCGWLSLWWVFGFIFVGCNFSITVILFTCLQANQMEDWAELIFWFLFAYDSTEQVDAFWLACNGFHGDTTSYEFFVIFIGMQFFFNINLMLLFQYLQTKWIDYQANWTKRKLWGWDGNQNRWTCPPAIIINLFLLITHITWIYFFLVIPQNKGKPSTDM
jgi:hypothetical protein